MAGICSTGISLVNNVVEETFAEIEHRKSLTDKDFSCLRTLFGSTLTAALGLIDMEKIDQVTSRSGRILYLVHGSMSYPYVCFKHYCPCQSFSKSVINRTETLACKHTLAVRLASALQRHNSIEMEDDEFSQYLTRDDRIQASA